MNYKKIFSATALVTLLSVSNVALSDSISAIDEDDEETSFYLRGQYQVDFFSKDGDIKGKENASLKNNNERSARGWDKSGNFGDAKPKHKISWFNAGAALGYRMEGIRFELEGLYAGLSLDDDGYKSDKSAGYLEFTRNSDESPDLTGTAANMKTADTDTSKAECAAFKMKNEGFSVFAAMANAYYDVDLGQDIPVVPYVGVGLGAAKVKYLESEGKGFTDNLKLAYQVRAGVSYAISPMVKLYAGGRYFSIFNNEFSSVKPTTEIKGKKGTNDVTSSTTATVKTNYGVGGLEVGAILNF